MLQLSSGGTVLSNKSVDETHMIKLSQRSLIDELRSFGFRDWMDDLVYQKARQIFFERAKQYGCISHIPSPSPPSPPPPPLPQTSRASKHRSRSAAGESHRLCNRGIRSMSGHGSVCCPSACGRCDGKGCSSREGGVENCCGNAIWRLGLACTAKTQAGPCIIGGQYSQAFSQSTWGVKAEDGPQGAVAAPPVKKKDLQINIKQATCQNGVRSLTGARAVCCPSACSTCDGKGCSTRPGGPRHCCGMAIWKGGRTCLTPDDTLCIIGGEGSRAFAPHAWSVCKSYYSLLHGQYVQVGQRKMYCPGAKT